MNTNRQAMEIRFSIPILPPFRPSHASRGGKTPDLAVARDYLFVLVYIKDRGSSQQTSCYRDLKLDEFCISNPKFRNFELDGSECIGAVPKVITGDPKPEMICTSR